jgi:ketosteroid isomerase-like protein
MPSTANDIADELRAAYKISPEAAAEALGARLAEKFEFRHDPPTPADGMAEAATAIVGRRNELVAFRKALTDFSETAEISTEGDELLILLTITGTLADGRPLSANIDARYRVADGEIVGMLAKLPANGPMLMEALQAGGWSPGGGAH